MDPKLVDIFLQRLPEIVLIIFNGYLYFLMRKISIDNEDNRAKDEQIKDMQSKNDELRLQMTLMEGHYNSLIEQYKSQEGELRVYKRNSGHDNV